MMTAPQAPAYPWLVSAEAVMLPELAITVSPYPYMLMATAPRAFATRNPSVPLISVVAEAEAEIDPLLSMIEL